MNERSLTLKSDIVSARWPVLLLLLLVGAMGSGCETQVDPHTGPVNLKFTRELLHPAVAESGVRATTTLEVAGQKDRNLLVTAFADETFYLGHRSIQPRYEYSIWEKFRLFMPYSNLIRPDTGPGHRIVRDDFKLNIYIQPADDRGIYVGKTSYTTTIRRPSLITQWRSFDRNAFSGSGGRGFEAEIGLYMAGFKGQSGRLVTLVRYQNYADVAAVEGGPLRIEGPRLDFPYDSTGYNSLDVFVPYSALAHLYPTTRLVLTPSVQVGDDIFEGTVHFHCFAAGTIGAVEEEAREYIDFYERRISAIERQIEHLQAGRGAGG